ncbi:MAG: hypothetical protein ACU0CA_00580 [Paracoccaceae bacterium]
MAEKFEIKIAAERYIHNDLSNCSWQFQKMIHKKIASGEREGVYHYMMASLIFSAFSFEAKLNFVGWKILGEGWPERANFREKLTLLAEKLKLELNWGERPLQTMSQLKRFRDTLAHGKPEIVDETRIVDVEPSVWEALKGQWESSVTPEFVDQCREDEKAFWKILLDAAGIDVAKTLTHGGHTLRSIIERT